MALLEQPLWVAIVVFAAAVGAITAAGTRMAKLADRLADCTGLGEAITGGVLLGASTSLSGIITSVSTAAQGFPELAFSNAVGGIAAQTMFLAIADITYRRANLEHAAASLTNLIQAALLVALLSVPLLSASTPAWTIGGVHPGSLVLLGAYLLGVRLAKDTHSQPLWGATPTDETRLDEPEEASGNRASLRRLGLRFALLALVVGASGYALGESGIALASKTGLSETLVGSMLTAVATSLPELVTTVAAVRRGALTLAVGGIIGGNTFDVLLIAASDIAYRDGSLYHAGVSAGPSFLIHATILMTAVLLLGLLRRERHGIANIGFESLLVLLIYGACTAMLFFGL
ncbi:sodium:calcium antiporter [Haliangium ochraceum]|nr:cation transporter [Haliangium ochraceum]